MKYVAVGQIIKLDDEIKGRMASNTLALITAKALNRYADSIRQERRGPRRDGETLVGLDDKEGTIMPLVHPGEILLLEYMHPLAISAADLARKLHIPASRLHQILLGRRAITADTALRLARYFGTSAQVWMNLQSEYDLERADGIGIHAIKPRVSR